MVFGNTFNSSHCWPTGNPIRIRALASFAHFVRMRARTNVSCAIFSVAFDPLVRRCCSRPRIASHFHFPFRAPANQSTFCRRSFHTSFQAAVPRRVQSRAVQRRAPTRPPHKLCAKQQPRNSPPHIQRRLRLRQHKHTHTQRVVVRFAAVLSHPVGVCVSEPVCVSVLHRIDPTYNKHQQPSARIACEHY